MQEAQAVAVKVRRQLSDTHWSRIHKLAVCLDRCSSFVRAGVNCSPAPGTSVVWNATCSIMGLYLEHNECFIQVSGALEMIGVTMDTCEVYAEMYMRWASGPSKLPGDMDRTLQHLNDALPRLFAAVLVFAAKAKKFFLATWMSEWPHRVHILTSSRMLTMK